MIEIRSTVTAFAVQAAVLAGLAAAPVAHAQTTAASSPEAGDGSASQVATKKPAKPGVQSGAQPASKSPTPSADASAPRAGEVATKKPAKAGVQSGPQPAASAAQQ